MKRLLCACVSLLLLSAGADGVLDLNGDWEFAFTEDAAAEAFNPSFEATGLMMVPGCWDFTKAFYMRRGLGSYRRDFTLSEDVKGATLVVKGMGLRGAFFLDGKRFATAELPFSTLEFETGPLTAGKHVLGVGVDNLLLVDDPSRIYQPYYDFYLSGGFYHGVELKLRTSDTVIDKVLVRTRDYRTGTVELEVLTRGVPPPTSWSAFVAFDGGAAEQVVFTNGKATVKVPHFKLWSPAHPNLHTVVVNAPTVQPLNRPTAFGIREIKAAQKKFWLNGEEIRFLGVNRHESDPVDGYATDRALMEKDVKLVKSLGANFIRGSHYPQCDDFLDICDREGVLVWNESLGWGNNVSQFANPTFCARQIEQTALMATNSLNHPCIVVDAYLNEFRSQVPEGKAFSERLIDVLRAADTGHLISFASCEGDISNEKTDFISFNRYPAWHGTMGRALTPATLKAEIHRCFTNSVAILRRQYGEDKPMIISETGCYSLAGEHDPMGAQWSEEFQAEYLTDWMDEVLPSSEMAGFLVWQFCDSRTYFRGTGDIRTKPLGYNRAGLFDKNRVPKMAADAVRTAFTADNEKKR